MKSSRPCSNLQQEIEKVASSLPEAAWSKGVYESGWNAKQLLCHLADDSVTTFLLALAQRPPDLRADPPGFDLDAFNNRQVALRENKSVDELLDQTRANVTRDIRAIDNADETLLEKPIRAPWGAEGPLADIILRSRQDHFGTHLADLRSAAG